jgi:hypothetical protein
MQGWRTSCVVVVWWYCCSLKLLLLLLTAPTAYAAQDAIRGDGRHAAAARADKETKPSSRENVFDEANANTDNGKQQQQQQQQQQQLSPPNVLIFIVDDLGWNQVGYHANPAGNLEIKTPHIDAHAAAGLALNRGYMTPWWVYNCFTVTFRSRTTTGGDILWPPTTGPHQQQQCRVY